MNWLIDWIDWSFRKKDLYLIITQKAHILKIWQISPANLVDFMKSGRFSPEIQCIFMWKSTQNLIKSDVFNKKLFSLGGAGRGAMTQDLMKSCVIAPLLHSSNWIVFGWKHLLFIRFWVDFMWNPLDFTWNLPDFHVDFMKSGGFRKTTCKEL